MLYDKDCMLIIYFTEPYININNLQKKLIQQYNTSLRNSNQNNVRNIVSKPGTQNTRFLYQKTTYL